MGRYWILLVFVCGSSAGAVDLLDVYKDSRLGSATNLSMVGYLALDFSLTKRKHIRHRW